MRGFLGAALSLLAGMGFCCLTRFVDRRLDLLLDHGWRACLGAGRPASTPWRPFGNLAFTLAAALVFVPPVMAHGSVASRFGLSYFLGSLLMLARIDADHRILPDFIQLPLMLTGYVLAWWQGLPGSFAVAGGMAGMLLGLALHQGGRGGLGWGDVKLLAALGPWLGSLGVLAAFALAAIAFLLWPGRHRRSETPFGPFLAIGSLGVIAIPIFSGAFPLFPEWAGYDLGSSNFMGIYNLFSIDPS